MNRLFLNMSSRANRMGVKTTAKYHLIGLLVYSVWVVGLDLAYLRSSFKLPVELIILAQSVWIFYTFYASLYFQFLGPRQRRLLAIPMLAICLTGSFGFTSWYGVYHQRYTKEHYNFQDLLYLCSQNLTLVSIYSVGYFFLVRYRQKQQQIRNFERVQAQAEHDRLALERSNAILQQEKLLLEKDLLQSENDFLRAQINPHFLYNCLNFFYSETFERQPRLGEAVLLLSQVMRYSLSDFSATGGLARLEGELEHIRNVVSIHRMRFGGSLYIDIACEGESKNKLILPMILMTLVENVMKHGDLTDPDSPALIKCQVDSEKRVIVFSTVNKKANAKADSHTGIGLANLVQRLNRLYGDKFTLTVNNDASLFREELVVPFVEDRYPPVLLKRTLNVLPC